MRSNSELRIDPSVHVNIHMFDAAYLFMPKEDMYMAMCLPVCMSDNVCVNNIDRADARQLVNAYLMLRYKPFCVWAVDVPENLIKDT